MRGKCYLLSLKGLIGNSLRSKTLWCSYLTVALTNDMPSTDYISLWLIINLSLCEMNEINGRKQNEFLYLQHVDRFSKSLEKPFKDLFQKHF